MTFATFNEDWDQESDSQVVCGKFKQGMDVFLPSQPAQLTSVDENTLEIRLDGDTSQYYRFVVGSPQSARIRLVAEHRAHSALGLVQPLESYSQFELIALTGTRNGSSYFGMAMPVTANQEDDPERLAQVARLLQSVPRTLEYVAQQLRRYAELSEFSAELTAFAGKIRADEPATTEQAVMLYLQAQRYVQQLQGTQQVGVHRNTRRQAHRDWYSKLSPGARAAIVFGLGIVLGALVLFILHRVAKAKTRSERWVAGLWLKLSNPRPLRRTVRVTAAPGGSTVVPAAYRQLPLPCSLNMVK